MTSILARIFSRPKKHSSSSENPIDYESPSCLNINDVLKDRFVIKSIIGYGSFGEIYKVYDRKLSIDAALKSELKSTKREKRREQLPIELAVLKCMQGKLHFAQLYCAGTESVFNFIVMQILGPNLCDLRRLCPAPEKAQCFSAPTVLNLGLQVLDALASLHERGVIHRDIKASNIVMGVPDSAEKDVAFIVDFGLSRFFMDANGRHRPERERAPFRGTLRYCSANAHRRLDLSRRDDLQTLFYMLCELWIGSLPWSGLRNDEEILTFKEDLCPPEELSKNVHPKMAEIAEYIGELSFYDTPDYHKMRNIISEIALDLAIPLDDCVWDWENNFEYLSVYQKKKSIVEE